MNQGTTAFPHQMFRDYLSAKYIVKQTNSKKNVLALWNERPIPFSIIFNIRQIDKQYWHHTAQCVRQEAAKVANVSVLVQICSMLFLQAIKIMLLIFRIGFEKCKIAQ